MALTTPVIEIVNQSENSLLGKHPSWERVRLGDIAYVQNGFAFKSTLFDKNDGIPLIRIRDIGMDITQVNYSGDYDSAYLVYPGDLLVGMDGDFNCARWKGPKGLLNQRVCRVKIHSEIYLEKLLEYVLPGYLIEINKHTSSVTVKHLSSESIKEIPLPLPPKEQQTRIVAEIEKQFSRLDEAVENLQRVKANLKRYKASVLKAAVEGKLTEQWRAEHPAVEPASLLLERILKERRKKWEENELAKMKAKGKVPKGDKWKSRFKEPDPLDTSALSELPETWNWTRVEEVGHVQLGRQRAPKYHSGANMRPYLRVQNVFEDLIDLDDVMEMDFPPNDFKNYQLKPGDILLNEGQSPELLGRPAIYRGELPNACFTNTLIRFQVFSPMQPEFSLLVFRAYMRSRRFTKAGTITTNIAHLSAGRFAKIEYPFPPLEEQDEIVKESQMLLSIIDAFSIETDRAIVRTDRLRQSILKKAFSGRLVPSNEGYYADSADDLPLAAEQSTKYGVQN